MYQEKHEATHSSYSRMVFKTMRSNNYSFHTAQQNSSILFQIILLH